MGDDGLVIESRYRDGSDGDRQGDSVLVDELLRGHSGLLDSVHYFSFRSGFLL